MTQKSNQLTQTMFKVTSSTALGGKGKKFMHLCLAASFLFVILPVNADEPRLRLASDTSPQTLTQNTASQGTPIPKEQETDEEPLLASEQTLEPIQGSAARAPRPEIERLPLASDLPSGVSP